MKTSRRAKSLTVSDTRWLAYATAGLAGGFGLAPAAEGEIHYSGIVNARLEGNNYVFATLPLSGGASLRFEHFLSEISYSSGTLTITGAKSASARGYKTTSHNLNFVTNIKHGSPISTGSFVPTRSIGAYIRSFFGKSYFYGQNGRGFIGFRFNTGRGMQYGWARLELQRPSFPSPFRYIVKDYAWGDPGDPVAAGQKKSLGEKVSVIPETGSLGLLATGAAGLEVWRKARGQAPTEN